MALPRRYDSRTDQAVNELIGICRGIIADEQVNEREVLYLDAWLRNHHDATAAWPGNAIADRIRKVLADGVIAPEETSDLLETLTSLVGDAVDEGVSTRLPVTDSAPVDFEGNRFCVTGLFLFGGRPAVHRAIEIRGGIPQPRITTDLDYLIIGTAASREWAGTSFGRKIETAIRYREGGHPIRIISEEHWIDSL